MAALILMEALEEGRALPDAIVLDLDLGLESGFELLRFCHKNRLIPHIPVAVWTVMGKNQEEICRLFGAREFINKHQGPPALLEALLRIHTPNQDQAAG
jgi:CheY-like chemotaxis protein